MTNAPEAGILLNAGIRLGWDDPSGNNYPALWLALENPSCSGVTIDEDSNQSSSSFRIRTSAQTDVLSVHAATLTGDTVAVASATLTTGNVLHLTANSTGLTSGNVLSASVTLSSASLPTTTGAIASLSYSLTGTATTGTVSPTNSVLKISATCVQNGAGGTLAPSGDVVSITLVSTQTAGTLTDSRVALHVVVPSGVTGVPFQVDQSNLTSTHFKKVATLGGATVWVSDGNTPNAALTGTAGDICLNGDASNRMFVCKGTTTWAAASA